MVLTASCDQTVKMWDIASASCVETFRFSEKKDVKKQQLGVVWGAAAMVSADLSGNLNLLDPSSPNQNKIIPGLCTHIDSMAIDYDNQLIYAGASFDRECKVVGYRPAPSVDQLYGEGVGAITTVSGKGPSVVITGMAVRAGRLICISMDGKLSVGDVSDPENPHYVAQVSGLEVPTKELVLANDGVAYIATQKRLSIHTEAAGFEKVAELKVDFSPLSMSLSPTETELAVSTDLKKVRGGTQDIHLFNITPSSIQPLCVITGTRHVARAISFCPHGRFLAAGDDNREVRFYNRDNDWAPELEDYSFHGGRITSLSWDPSGERCVSGALDRGVVVHKMDRLKGSAVFERANAGPIGHLGFMNEDLFVTGGTDGTVSIFEFKRFE